MRKKDTIELVITVALGVFLLIISVALYHRTNTKRASVPASAAGTVTAVSGAGPLPGYRLRRMKVSGVGFINRFVMATSVLPLERDPFTAGQSGPQDPKAALSLDGIMWNAEKPTAIIGTAFVNEGDAVGRFKVVKIYPTKVVLREGDSEFELFLKGSS